MSLIYIDSFDHIDSSESKWRTVTINSTGGRTNQAATSGYRVLPGEFTSLTAGVAFKHALSGGINTPIRFSNVRYTGYNFLAIADVGDGRLYVAGSRTGQVYASTPSVAAFVNDQWYYLELSGTTTDSLVAYELKVNEETWCSGTFTYTGTTVAITTLGWADLELGAAGGGSINYYDDLYVRSDDTFHGDVDVICLRPNGTTTLSEWTPYPGTATNYTCVDDSIPNEDTDYVTATDTGLVDLYEMEDVGAFTGEIFGVQGVQDIKKIEAGAGRTRQVWVNGITGTDTYTSSEFYPSAIDYLFQIVTLGTSPFSTNTWSAAEVDALRFGVERTV